ncbi:hypothetical protein GWI33_007091 [Rhynchophorus ferrugineus]|uniref:inositol-1,4-bisphosphate 1-phosphatase n=1 Tax=Rhynchophorus ferrugineus TaxID=354439 RepID=A0A834MII7_RHYFE|nr:hypothetical protein GWI33_007091 [Rhynchophorus ferrugineus]
MDLLKALIVVSEKAANIARTLRQNESLFSLLVEQKSDNEANPRFNEDFKTLADVLIQQMTRHDIGLQFPDLKQSIEGEESNHIVNKLGEEVDIEIKDSAEETARLLSKVMDGDVEAARVLADEVHRTVSIDEVDTKTPTFDFDVDLENIGIWIDPIDGTNEYVKADEDVTNGEFFLKGLKCVTVLIGAYDKRGVPIMGIINQPFYCKTDINKYQCHWGVCYQGREALLKASSIDEPNMEETHTLCVGISENPQYIQVLKDAGYNLTYPKGAGYKLLTVILGISDAYILSKPTTYMWDTCAPQAILRSLGGEIINMTDMVTKKKSNVIKYGRKGSTSTKNIDGIVAYRYKNVINKLVELNWTA